MTFRKTFAAVAVVLNVLGNLALAAEPPPPWAEIKAKAEQFVRNESPAAVWPFARASGERLRASEKKVFPHYFLPFPLSFSNEPAATDTYARLHLSPEGSDRHLAGRGGYKVGGGGVLRQRPLPAGPWDSPHWRQINFAIDILRARELGADGFGVDLLSINSGRLWDELLLLMDTAEAVAPGFGILLEPDMSALKNKASVAQLVEALLTLSRRASAYRLADGRLVVAPYRANGQPPEYWREVIAGLSAQGVEVAFWPIFLGFEKLAEYGAAYGPLSYGFSDWGFRDIAFAELVDFKHAKQKSLPFTPRWMMAVSPQDVRAKGLIAWEAENTKAFRYLWDAAIQGGSDWVHLVTWNDYSEASEVSPSSCSQYLYYDLGAYYAEWFKLGRAPAIERDAIYYSHRSQIFPLPQAPSKQREPFRVAGKTPFVNDVELVALLTAPAVLEIEQNGQVARYPAEAGLASFRVSAQVGRPVFRIVRDRRAVVETASAWEITDRGETENPVYCGGSSTRAFVAVPRAPAAPEAPVGK